MFSLELQYNKNSIQAQYNKTKTFIIAILENVINSKYKYVVFIFRPACVKRNTFTHSIFLNL